MWYGCKLSDAVAMDPGGGCFLFVVEVMLCYNPYLMCSPWGGSTVSSSWGYSGLEAVTRALRIQNSPRAALGWQPARRPQGRSGAGPTPRPARIGRCCALDASGGQNGPRGSAAGGGPVPAGVKGSRGPRLHFGPAAARPRAPPEPPRPRPRRAAPSCRARRTPPPPPARQPRPSPVPALFHGSRRGPCLPPPPQRR